MKAWIQRHFATASTVEALQRRLVVADRQRVTAEAAARVYRLESAAALTALADRRGAPSSGTRNDGLIGDEGETMDALVTAVRAFNRCHRQHPDEMRDFADGIHRCQDQLALRVARRAFPDGWPTYEPAS